jgi:hypothetical protein
MGKTRRTGDAFVSTGVQSMKAEGPGTDKARVLGADMMVDTMLLAVEVPETGEARTLLQYFFCIDLSRLSNLAILASSFSLCLRLDVTPLHFRHPLFIIFLCFCKNLGLSATVECDNTAAHQGVIAVATPAVQFILLPKLCIFLVLSDGCFCLARVRLGTGHTLHKETLAGDNLAGNVKDLLTFIFGRLHSCKVNRKHTPLIGPREIVGGRVLGIVLTELGHQCAIQPLDKAIAQADCILPLRSKRTRSIHHPLLIVLNDAGGDRLAIGTHQHLANALENCVWLVAVAGAELDEDERCYLLEAKTEGLCMDILADGDGIDI